VLATTKTLPNSATRTFAGNESPRGGSEPSAAYRCASEPLPLSIALILVLG
jgi:hypothetical protein